MTSESYGDHMQTYPIARSYDIIATAIITYSSEHSSVFKSYMINSIWRLQTIKTCYMK